MKPLALLLIVMLFGCAPEPTLEDLERQAIVTGDWSAVERREKRLSRSAAIDTFSCPKGLTEVCVEESMKTRCFCVRPTSLK